MRGGFRLDSEGPNKIDKVTLQGDIYSGNEGFQGPVPSMNPPFTTFPDVWTHEGGGDVLGRWTHVVNEDNTFFVQAYFDKMDRTEPYFDIKINTFDLEFQQNIKHNGNHVFTWVPTIASSVTTTRPSTDFPRSIRRHSPTTRRARSSRKRCRSFAMT